MGIVIHCFSISFMTKAGSNKEVRTTEALADIGAAVLNGAISTFLAVVVLLFSSSYVFKVLSQQFALTVTLGITHGLILLREYQNFGPPVPLLHPLTSLLAPPFSCRASCPTDNLGSQAIFISN